MVGTTGACFIWVASVAGAADVGCMCGAGWGDAGCATKKQCMVGTTGACFIWVAGVAGAADVGCMCGTGRADAGCAAKKWCLVGACSVAVVPPGTALVALTLHSQRCLHV